MIPRLYHPSPVLLLAAVDRARVLTLARGAYTMRIADAGGTTGVALVEVYLLP